MESWETEINIASVRQDWHRRGFSCDLWIDTPGQRWEGSVHSHLDS
jgi:hypothetical protein